MVILKDTVNQIKDSEEVKSWLQNLSPNSKTNYLEALAEFCKINEITPEKMLNIIHHEEEERKPTWQRSINKWFEAFDEHCRKLKRRKGTRDTRRTIVNAFIGFCGLPQYTQRGGRRKIVGLRDSNQRENLTKEDIQSLLHVCKSFKMRAMILAQASSGLASIDILGLKVKDFQDGLDKVFDDNTEKYRRICCLNLERKKTGVKFTTFFSEETIKSIEKYLEIERTDLNPEDALFSSYKSGGKHMSTIALQEQYRRLNEYLGWKTGEKGEFRKATSHMMRKFFNTQLINAGMPEEIREHFMGHKFKDRVRDAYFLASADDLKKVYLQYMEHVTVNDINPLVSISDYKELKMNYHELRDQNDKLCDMVTQMKKELESLKCSV